MKKKRMGVLAASLALTGAMASPYNVFAEVGQNDNNFGIVYSGGHMLELGNNVTDGGVNGTNLIPNLTKIIPHQGVKVTTNTNGSWQSGYILGQEHYQGQSQPTCRKYKYLVVGRNGITGGDNSFTIEKGDYRLEATIDKVTVEEPNENLPFPTTAIGVVDGETTSSSTGLSGIYGGWAPYSDAQCQNPVSNISDLQSSGNDNKLFIQMHMKVYRKGNPFASDDFYLGLIDIDAAQSYMINDFENMFATPLLYAESQSELQPDSGTSLRNVYVERQEGSQYPSYIYSQYNENGGFNVDETTKLYAKINRAAQMSANGVDFVFGFAGKAGSRIEYWTRQYKVQYNTTEGGKVTVSKEDVISGDSPEGSDTTADKGYVFDYWTTDQDVRIPNGNNDPKLIRAGEKIEMSEIQSLSIHDNYSFTAHFKPESDQSKSYVVEYVANEGGSIDGTTREDVDEGKNPSGSSAKADEGYEFDGWTTDQDVTLDDGTTVIKKGEVITDEQIKHVVVDKNMQFTAHFKKKAGSPDTGAFSGDIGAVTIATASTLGLLLVAVAIKVLPQITRRRVKFD